VPKIKYDFFKSLHPKNPHEVDKVELFLQEGLTETKGILRHPEILRMFLRYNTELPSSASVERLFSTGVQIFKPTRNRLSDTTFERVLFLKTNSSLDF
jgi:hypothetical protein